MDQNKRKGGKEMSFRAEANSKSKDRLRSLMGGRRDELSNAGKKTQNGRPTIRHDWIGDNGKNEGGLNTVFPRRGTVERTFPRETFSKNEEDAISRARKQ